jgi:hypothetical protein
MRSSVRAQDRESGLALAVNLQQTRDAGGPQERRVTGQDHHVTVGVAYRFVNGGECHRDGVTGAELLALLDKGERTKGRRSGAQFLFDPRGVVAHHHHRRPDVSLSRGVQDVAHHGAPTEMVKGFRA